MKPKTPINEAAKELGERIEKVAAKTGGKRSLAKQIGIHETQLYRYINGSNVPSALVAASIAEAGKVSTDWLITGSGQGIVRESKGTYTNETDRNDYHTIPLYDAFITGSTASWREGARVITFLAFSQEALARQRLDPQQLSAIRISGDAMSNLLNDGDTVLIDHSQTAIADGGIYVLPIGDCLQAKRLQVQFDGTLNIISQNQTYQTTKVSQEQLGKLSVIGRVVWASGWI